MPTPLGCGLIFCSTPTRSQILVHIRKRTNIKNIGLHAKASSSPLTSSSSSSSGMPSRVSFEYYQNSDTARNITAHHRAKRLDMVISFETTPKQPGYMHAATSPHMPRTLHPKHKALAPSPCRTDVKNKSNVSPASNSLPDRIVAVARSCFVFDTRNIPIGQLSSLEFNAFTWRVKRLNTRTPTNTKTFGKKTVP